MKGSSDFLNELRRFVPAHARLMMCQFRGDPQDDIIGKWRARVLNDEGMIDEGANVYVCVSAMKQNARGEFRRRRENFAGGLCLMIDDVGTGPGSKFPVATITALPPTAMVETSRDNFQATYFFDSLLEDEEEFDALIRAFIAQKFLGADTGQAGINRVFRPPAGVNGKAKHQGWRVRMTEWAPERRYGVQEIVDAFGLKLVKRVAAPRIPDLRKSDRIDAFMGVYAELKELNMTKRSAPDYSGWIPVRCPWTHEHTGGKDNGAAIRVPADENRWTGAFRCHHGSCAHRDWSGLTEWLAAQHEDHLKIVNAQAGDFNRWKKLIGKNNCTNKQSDSEQKKMPGGKLAAQS